MSDSSNSYTADAGQVQRSAEAIERIAAAARKILADFVNDVDATRGWPGVDDSFFKAVSPQEKKETEMAMSTTRTLSEAVVAVAAGTSDNATSILATQASQIEAIHTAGNASTTHSGRH